ncbi:MAG: hybrid sensor histidine kinase/response regulator, partial [Steroidobacteraceae bacterium]
LEGLERDGVEPQGSDADLIGRLLALALSEEAMSAPAEAVREDDRLPVHAVLDELERAWRAAPGPEAEHFELAEPNGSGEANPRESHSRAQTVRVSVDTLEHLMTTVSELVLTRNQLLDIVRRTGESEFKSPLQRLSTVTAELQEGIMKARMQPI